MQHYRFGNCLARSGPILLVKNGCTVVFVFGLSRGKPIRIKQDAVPNLPQTGFVRVRTIWSECCAKALCSFTASFYFFLKGLYHSLIHTAQAVSTVLLKRPCESGGVFVWGE